MLGLFKKKKEDSAMTEDEKQAAEAEAKMKERGEEDGTKDQTAQAVKDETVGAEEKAAGDENSQSAKAREHESEGTKEYDEKKAEEKREEKGGGVEAKIDALIDRFDRFLSVFEKRQEEKEDRMERAAEKYGLAPSPNEGAKSNDRYTQKDAERLRSTR